MAREFDPEKHCGGKTNPLNGATPCTLRKGWGTDHTGAGHCRLHGGTTPSGRKAAVTEAAERALERMGQPIAKKPDEALMHLVWEAVGNVYFLRHRVAELGFDVIGDVHAIAQRDGEVLKIGEDVLPIVKLYGEWADRLAKYSKAAIDAGIAKRQIELAEQTGELIVRVVELTLDGLSLTPDQFERGRSLAAAALRDAALSARN